MPRGLHTAILAVGLVVYLLAGAACGAPAAYHLQAELSPRLPALSGSAPSRPSGSDPASWPATQRDLAEIVDELYKAQKRGEKSLRIIRIAVDDYLVIAPGTNRWTGEANDWPSNVSSGRQIPSRYQLQIKRLIEENVPAGATLHLAGHSQSAYVMMNLAGTQELAGRYRLGSVSTFGGAGLAPYNPCLDPAIYHNYLVVDDPIQLVPLMSRVGLPLFGFTNTASLPGAFGAPTAKTTLLLEQFGHEGYRFSQLLARVPLPFKVERWEVVIAAAPSEKDNLRLAWDDVATGIKTMNRGRAARDPNHFTQGALQAAGGAVDMAVHVGLTTLVAASQNIIGSVAQVLPVEAQVAIDRLYDQAGVWVATAPRPSQAGTQW